MQQKSGTEDLHSIPLDSDMAVYSVRELRDNGVSMTHLEFLRAMESSIPEEMTFRMDCKEIAATLLVMLQQ